MLILDNGFLNIIYFYGIFGFVTVAYFFRKIFQDSINNEKIILTVLMIVYLLYGLTEANFYKLIMNPFMLYYGYIMYNSKKELIDSE